VKKAKLFGVRESSCRIGGGVCGFLLALKMTFLGALKSS